MAGGIFYGLCSEYIRSVSGYIEDTTVQVVVTDNRTDAEKYTPEFDQIEKNYGAYPASYCAFPASYCAFALSYCASPHVY